jgi:lysophospholipase L1-like esterase
MKLYLIAEQDELCRHLPGDRARLTFPSHHSDTEPFGEHWMNAATSLLLASTVTIATSIASAQTPATQPQTPLAPQPIDPIYTTPSASLTTQQVVTLQHLAADWPQLNRYRADNEKLSPPVADESRVVFYGDSITDNWGRFIPVPFFPGKPYINRGISGQTTAQMVIRFRQDVIDLSPAVVLILAGTNDLAGNTGLSSLQMIEDNMQSMSELAKAHNIRVILASVLPVSDYPWRPGLHPADEVRTLNDWMKSYAHANGLVYLDYYATMANAQGGLDPSISLDGVHPNAAGYAIMAPLADKAIQQAIAR